MSMSHCGTRTLPSTEQQLKTASEHWLGYSMIMCWLRACHTIWFEYCVYSGAQSSLPGSLLPHGHEDEDESFPAPLAHSTNGCQWGELQSPGALFLTDWHHTRLMLPLFKRLPLSPLAHTLLLAPSISQDGFGHQIPTGLSIKAQSSCSEAKLNWKPRGHINTSQVL